MQIILIPIKNLIHLLGYGLLLPEYVENMVASSEYYHSHWILLTKGQHLLLVQHQAIIWSNTGLVCRCMCVIWSWWFNTSPPSAAYMRQWNGSLLAQIMGCRLFGGVIVNWTLRKKCSKILIKIQNFSFTKMHLKISSVKWWPFCPGGYDLNTCLFTCLLCLLVMA